MCSRENWIFISTVEGYCPRENVKDDGWIKSKDVWRIVQGGKDWRGFYSTVDAE